MREANAAIQRARQGLSNTDLSGAVQGNRPNWTLDTPPVAAVLDTVDTDVLDSAVFITVKDIGKKRQKTDGQSSV